MQTHFTHLFTPLRVRGIMFPNRIFLSPQGHSPKHRHPSSYDSLYDAGMLFFDKSQGGFGGCTLAQDQFWKTATMRNMPAIRFAS